MYIDFFGLHEKPFNITPDPSFLYLSKKHQEALAHLTYGIKERKGFITITGEIGAGKTTLCRTLLNRIRKDVRTAYILNSNITSDMQLLRMIIDDFGIKPSGKNKVALLKAMNEFLIEQTMIGNNVVIIIDEAQNLRPRVLEQIRMLSNLETDKEKLLQIIFVGQPELKDILNSPELVQLNQRITVRCHISALGREDVVNYINHRLCVAGANGAAIFSPQAVDEVYNFSGGIPRLINIICDRALLLAFVLEQKDITDEMIKKSAQEVRGLQ
jgi:general secretion pathway protein A